MSLRTFIVLQLLLGVLACVPPTPKPEPLPDTTVIFDPFEGFSSEFLPADNAGNAVTFDSTNMVLNNSVTGSGWAYTADTFELRDLEFEVGLNQVSSDYCTEFSDSLYKDAANGFYKNYTRFRAYIHSDQHLLHVEYQKSGEMQVNQDLFKRVAVPVKVRLKFTQDSLFYDYFDSTWTNAFRMKETWPGLYYFALTSVGKTGTTKVDYVKITLSKPEFGEATLEWNKNTEKDLKNYYPEAMGYQSAVTRDTSYTFRNLPKGQEIGFRVAADDTVGNKSAWSDTVKTVIK